MLGKSRLPFTLQEYDEWVDKLESGYGQPRPGVSSEELEAEIAAIPKGLRHTYIVEKYIGREKFKGDSHDTK
ncbi:hypothetical protein ES703_121483 [subsurface metagenome]